MVESSSLIQQIEQAFANVVYPGDDNLADSLYGEEPEALRIEFRGKTDWRTLDDDFLNQAPDGWGTALSFFSPTALKFYLPAYLIADIRGTLQCSDPAFRLCIFVTPQLENKKIAKVWGGGTLGEIARQEFDIYSSEQVAAIVAYLWWKLESDIYNPVVEQGLENYWLERDITQ